MIFFCQLIDEIKYKGNNYNDTSDIMMDYIDTSTMNNTFRSSEELYSIEQLLNKLDSYEVPSIRSSYRDNNILPLNSLSNNSSGTNSILPRPSSPVKPIIATMMHKSNNYNNYYMSGKRAKSSTGNLMNSISSNNSNNNNNNNNNNTINQIEAEDIVNEEQLAMYNSLKTGEDVLKMYAMHGVNCPLKIVYLNGLYDKKFKPYELVVVPRKYVYPEYYTMSSNKVVHVKPDYPTETYTLEEWKMQSGQFNMISSIPFFRYFLIRYFCLIFNIFYCFVNF